MEYVFGCRPGWLRTIAAGVGAAIVLTLSTSDRFPTRAALPSYPLYYSLEIPLALLGLVLSENGTQKTYTGTLKGRLGGLPLTSATYEYRTGSTGVGGGMFSLATPAGTTRDGQILVTTDAQKTVLLFFGMYLGTRLEFSIVSDREPIGGAGVTAKGLARTGFVSHEDYRAAVQKAVAALGPTARDQILAEVDVNLRLVNEYERSPH